MTYKESLTNVMTDLGKKKNVVFLGEGLVNAGRIYGTLDGVQIGKCVEFPIAENLIIGASIGLALEKFRPIVIFQRMDFMTCAVDAIVNHLALIPKMSGGKVKLPVIIRAIIGSRSDKFVMGEQHSKDLTEMFKPWIHTIVLKKSMDIQKHYDTAYGLETPTLIIEDRDLYEEKV